MSATTPAIALRALTTLNALDLALLFLREYSGQLKWWLALVGSACLANYLIVDRLEGNLFTAFLLFVFASSTLGVLVGTVTARSAFPQPVGNRRTGVSTAVLIVQCLVLRFLTFCGFLLFVLPGCWLAVRFGFVVEERVLARQGAGLHDRPASDLIRGELGDLFLRGVSIFLYCGLMWVVLLATADAGAYLLFGKSILVGPMYETSTNQAYISELNNSAQYLFSFLWSDPMVVTALLAMAFVVYTLGRVAWFLCYVDLRVRRDCWDIELEIMREAVALRDVRVG